MGGHNRLNWCGKRVLQWHVEIEDHHALKAWHNDRLNLLMNRMWQILITRLCTGERHDEAVRESVVQALTGVIGAVVEIKQAGNAPDHARHGGETLVDLFWSDVGFELEAAVMFDLGHSDGGVGGLRDKSEGMTKTSSPIPTPSEVPDTHQQVTKTHTRLKQPLRLLPILIFRQKRGQGKLG